MHLPTKKKHGIKNMAQPPRKRRGFFHNCYFPVQLQFYLTKVNKTNYNKLTVNLLRLNIINSRLSNFVHFSGSYLTNLPEKYLFRHLLTYYHFNLSTFYPFKSLTLSCSLNKKSERCH